MCPNPCPDFSHAITSLRFLLGKLSMVSSQADKFLPERFSSPSMNSFSNSPEVFCVILSPETQDQADDRKVNDDVTAVDRDVLQRPLFEQRDDNEHRCNPSHACQKSGDKAPLPRRVQSRKKAG